MLNFRQLETNWLDINSYNCNTPQSFSNMVKYRIRLNCHKIQYFIDNMDDLLKLCDENESNIRSFLIKKFLNDLKNELIN